MPHDQGYLYPVPSPGPHQGGGAGHSGYWFYGQGFMVGAPQVSVAFKLGDSAAIAAIVGDRFAAFASGQEDRLRGTTGGASIRVGSTR